MILIADSGSTKTDWCLIHEGVVVQRIPTTGINPYFQTPEDISEELNHSLFPLLESHPIEAVFFYGAGCAFPEKNRILEELLGNKLQAPVEVHSDLMGAARGLCGLSPGIACILGTGSNSCLFDGVEIIEHIPPLGYILGDEGSGAVLGKLFVADCLKKRLPEPLIQKFMQRYELTPALILEKVYKEPFPNRFLANLSRFLWENLHEQPIRHLVRSSFQNFFVRNVMAYSGMDQLPIHFTGSIAFFYQDLLKEVGSALDLNIGMIMQSPMDGLIQYHTV
ncbi:ATPase [Parabacteroides sp. PF5-9]|uniref:ATPase n=1 Tax=Parabacteroides sp. PF5-9 TaxID=1742404 RepID=UPI0024738CEE|nr:ATPase [Parabacteroides sp. PF5-9]MDH6357596.1 N-acetylglucosamine kinase-like BadF-type ATPase [Parabacteroides sp. PF5-9]